MATSRIQEFEYAYGMELWATQPPFYGLLAALILRAGSMELDKLRLIFPDEVEYVSDVWNGRIASIPFRDVNSNSGMVDREGNSNG